MASLSSSSVTSSVASVLLLSFLACSLAAGIEEATRHIFNVQSLLPSAVCTPSKDLPSSHLQVVSQHGPCSPLNHSKKQQTTTSNHIQILKNDQIRVNWLHSKRSSSLAAAAAASSARTNSKSKSHGSSPAAPPLPPPPSSSSTIPASGGNSLGSGNFVVNVGFGTPKIPQSLIFDTGSDVTWIQCQPCVSSCYSQQDKLFDPRKSSTYRNISCSSPYCAALDASGCSGSTCLYAVQYGDNSYTVGFFAQDTLTLSPSTTIPNFRFGCGENNNGLFGQVAGLIGLGREQVSLVSQTSSRFGGLFSYCLPSTTSSTGYLSFGPTAQSSSSKVQFTPMLSESGMSTFYFLELTAITVGGKTLSVPPALFSNAGVIVDSGTVITRLPPTAYAKLRALFRKKMAKYPRVPASSILDTCYDLSKYKTVSIPAVALNFRGATANLDVSGVVYGISSTQACLAFAPNGNDTDLVIIGNTQQRRFNVVYDLSKKLIGFGPGGC